MPEEKKFMEKLTADVPLAHVKVKKEKVDPEVEAKINAISIANVKIKHESDKEKRTTQSNAKKLSKTGDNNVSEPGESDEDSSADDDDDENSNDKERSPDEDKKSIEPVKSSNEILAELFQVFNAAPPEELLNDDNLLKKSHKQNKVKKEKKKKIKREKDLSDGERNNSDASNDASNEDIDGKHKHKHKHKKKKKHKVKDEKDKARDKSKDRGKKDKDIQKARSRSTEKTKENLRKPTSDSASLDQRRESRSQKRHNDFHSTESTSAKRSRIESEHKSYHGRSHDRSRDRDKHNERDREKDEKHRIKERDKDNSDGRKSKDRKHNSFYNGYSQYESSKKSVKVKQEPKEKPLKNEKEDGQISEVSLSDDEEDYLRERERERERHKSNADSKRRDRFPHDNNNSTDRSRNNYYAGSKYDSRSRDRDRDREREREREKNYRGNGGGSRNNTRRSRSRGRDRSRSRSRDLGIDKKRLLEIARKNAISMFKRGSLPGCDGMSEEVKDKVLLKMRYGGKTVQDLTDFCKKISNGENLSDLSSDEDSDVDKSGNTKAFHHPFQLKEREPIVMHIRNSTKLPLRPTPSETVKAITMQFPVSSGQEHRRTEAWVPVVPKDNLPPLPALPAATQSTSIFKSNVMKNVFEKPIPEEEQQEPAFKPVQTNQAASTSNTTESTGNEAAVATTTVSTTPAAIPAAVAAAAADKPCIDPSKPFYAVPQPKAPPTGALNAAATIAAQPASTLPVSTQNFVPDVPVPSSMGNNNNSIFPEHSGAQIDVSSIISKRLHAMRRLQENPMDPEAIKMMYNSQKDMTSWASSKHIPGQFTGSTGANILSTRELNSGPQAWARRDQLITSRPVSGGMGMQLLQKMGWKPGEGLGRDKSGSLQPLLLDVKLDKHGLVARDDNTGGYNKQRLNRKPRPQNMEQHKQSLMEKHPVCLLNELTSKRKWTPPLYTLTNEAGPSHSKMFLFSVSINGQSYTPPKGSNTKKEAKLISARYCLQQMGILPSQ